MGHLQPGWAAACSSEFTQTRARSQHWVLTQAPAQAMLPRHRITRTLQSNCADISHCHTQQQPCSSQIVGPRVLEGRGFKPSPLLTPSKHNAVGLSQLATGLIHFPEGRPLRIAAQRGSAALAELPVPAEGSAPRSPPPQPVSTRQAPPAPRTLVGQRADVE